jgi:hypothetical protein
VGHAEPPPSTPKSKPPLQAADEEESNFFQEDTFGQIFAEAARPHGNGLQRVGISNLRGGIDIVLAQLVDKVQRDMERKVRPSSLVCSIA